MTYTEGHCRDETNYFSVKDWNGSIKKLTFPPNVHGQKQPRELLQYPSAFGMQQLYLDL